MCLEDLEQDFKGIPKLKTNFCQQKRIHILICLVLTKKIFDNFSHNFLSFFTLKNKPSRSRRSASGVKEKCMGGQGEMRQGSRKSASGVKEKCVRGQGEVRRGSRRSASGVKEKCVGGQGEVPPLIVWYSAEALHLDP